MMHNHTRAVADRNWRRIPSHPAYEISRTGSVRRAIPGRGTYVGRSIPTDDGWVRIDRASIRVGHLVAETWGAAGAYTGRIPYTRNQPPPKAILHLCSDCGSSEVLFDAFVVWDFERQEMVVASVMDGGHYCTECEAETTPIVRELAE